MFVSGHDFSRAVKGPSNEGFSPWAFLTDKFAANH